MFFTTLNGKRLIFKTNVFKHILESKKGNTDDEFSSTIQGPDFISFRIEASRTRSTK